jgi:C4-dicarboxylate-specific signal transduction histidine kinase
VPVIPAAEECLLVPFYVAGKGVGRICCRFDAEDERLVTGLGKFASTAYQALASIDELKFQIREREKAEAAVPVTLDLIASRLHPDDLVLWDCMIRWMRRGFSNFEYEHRLLMPDQAIKHLHLIGHRSQDKDGRREYIGAAQDVTQRHLSEEALTKARSELAHVARITSLGVLTVSIAHEVNEPLSGIITNASTCLRMLANEPPDIEGARQTAPRAIRDGKRASEVIARLRTLFVRNEATTEAVDLNEATREVIARPSLGGAE